MLKSLFIMTFALLTPLTAAFAMEENTPEMIKTETIAEPAIAVPAMDENPVEVVEAIIKEKPTIAVFYADWCGSCKILDPKMKEAMKMMDNQDAINIITFDLTDDTTKATSLTMANENGLGDLYTLNAPKTGFAVLVEDGKETVRITKADSVEAIKAKLETFIDLNS